MYSLCLMAYFVCLKRQAKNTAAQLKNIWIKKETSFSVVDLS